MGFIYKIENQVNNKIYIGLTRKTRPSDRFSQHKSSARHLKENDKSLLHKAMAKYGVDNFTFTVIEEVENELIFEREQYWIQKYNSQQPYGYNITKGGEGTPGFSRPQTKEEREKRRISNKQFFQEHPEAKEAICERTKQLWQNDEYRQKVIEGNKRFYSERPDIFRGKNNPFYGKHHTQETIQKIKAKSAYKTIAQVDKDTGEILQIFEGVRAAEKAMNISHGWLSKAAESNKIAYGFRWKFIESVTTNCNSEISTE